MKSIVRVLIAFLFAVTSIGTIAPAGLAQTNEPDPASSTFDSPLGDVTIDLGDSGEAVFDPTRYYASERYEYENTSYLQEDIGIEIGNSFVFITFLDGDVTPESWNQESLEVLPTYYNNLTLLGMNATEESSWMLTSGDEFLDITTASYSEFYEDMFEFRKLTVDVRALPSELIPTIQWIQSNITVDGEFILADADLSGIQAMLDGTSSIDPVELELPHSAISDWTDLGLESESRWVVPATGDVVTWDTHAMVLPMHKEEIVLELQFPDQSSLWLTAPDTSSMVYVNIDTSLTVDRLPNVNDDFEDSGFLEDRYYTAPALDTRLTEDSFTAVVSYDAGYPADVYRLLHYFTLSDGRVGAFIITGTMDSLADDYFAAISAISINGELVAPAYSEADLNAISASYSQSASFDLERTRAEVIWVRS